MAEAWFNHLASRRKIDLSARSAGTDPATAVQPLIAAVMAERGIDISLQIPRLLDDKMAASSDRLVTMGCDVDPVACPSIQFESVVDWQLPDPSGMRIDQVRKLCDLIHDEVELLLTSMTRHVTTDQDRR